MIFKIAYFTRIIDFDFWISSVKIDSSDLFDNLRPITPVINPRMPAIPAVIKEYISFHVVKASALIWCHEQGWRNWAQMAARPKKSLVPNEYFLLGPRARPRQMLGPDKVSSG